MNRASRAIAGGLILSGVGLVFVVHQTQTQLREKSQALRQRQEQIIKLTAENERLSALLSQTKSAPVDHLAVSLNGSASLDRAASGAASTNLFSRLTNGTAKLTMEQAEAYVQANGRSPASLLAAYRTTTGAAWLEEAMQKYPNDPHVAFEAAAKADQSPEDHRTWLDAFKKAAPDNSLANYLSALDYFKAGKSELAVWEVEAASAKRGFDDYTLERIQNDEEAFRAAGYSVVEAKIVPAMQLLLPQLAQLKEVGRNLIDLANSYQESGDQASAESALQMAVDLGQRYVSQTGGEPEISKLVGLAIERTALARMDPNSPYGEDGQTVKDRIEQIVQYRQTLRELNAQAEPLFPTLSEQDLISYKDRWRIFGEQAALRWVVDKYGKR